LGRPGPGTSFFNVKHWTQFCLAGLQEISPEEPKCTKTLGSRGFDPDPNVGAYSTLQSP